MAIQATARDARARPGPTPRNRRRRIVHGLMCVAGLALSPLLARAQAPDPPPAVAAGEVPVPSPGMAEADAGEKGSDLSGWLLDGRGFLPVPVVLTDPAIGTGGGVLVVFMRRPDAGEATPDSPDEKTSPHVFGVGAFRTSNGSYGVGAGAQLHLRDDQWRYTGGAGRISMNLEYFGPDLLPAGGRDLSVGYTMDGLVSSQRVQRRLGRDGLYAGLAWAYMDMDVAFDRPQDADRFDRPGTLSRRSSGLGVSLEYDSRDTAFTPSSGLLAAAEAMFFTTALGSDSDYRLQRLRSYAYWPLAPQWVLGGRVDLRTAQGDVPFYRLPYVEMRGIGAMRYQDTHALTLETEVRWNFAERWAAIGFAGAGQTWGRRNDWGDARHRIARGVGARYLLSSELGLYAGVDYAWGPEDGTFYVQVGSAWR